MAEGVIETYKENLKRYIAAKDRILLMEYCISELEKINTNLIRNDILKSQRYLTLLDSFIVCYGSLFASSKAIDHISFDYKEVYKGKPDLKKIHLYVNDLRDKVIAHLVFENESKHPPIDEIERGDVETFDNFIDVDLKEKEDEKSINLAFVMKYNTLWDKTIVPNFKRLHSQLFDYVEGKLKKICTDMSRATGKTVRLVDSIDS